MITTSGCKYVLHISQYGHRDGMMEVANRVDLHFSHWTLVSMRGFLLPLR